MKQTYRVFIADTNENVIDSYPVNAQNLRKVLDAMELYCKHFTYKLREWESEGAHHLWIMNARTGAALPIRINFNLFKAYILRQ